MGNQSRLNPFGKDTTVSLPPTVRDQFGRALQDGDHVFLAAAAQPLFKVIKVTPVLDPGAPANLMDIMLQCTVLFRAGRNQPNREFVRVMTALENPQQAPLQVQEEPEPEDEAPVPDPKPTLGLVRDEGHE
jgi:hypothetical protein